MKSLKLLSSAIVAAVAVVSFSAFKMAENRPVEDALKWFELQPGGNETNPDDYVLANGDGNSAPNNCPIGDDEKCGIHAQPSASDPTQPDLSTEVSSETIYRESTQN